MKYDLFKTIFKNAIYYISKKIPIYKLFSPFYGGIGSVLMLHRVVEKKDFNKVGIDGLEISSDYLEEIILYFLNNDYDILSIEDVYQIIIKCEKQKKRFVCFTFDDGYRDNYNIAYPIFKKYNLPFTVYINPSIINGTLPLWWICLGELVQNNINLTFKIGINNYSYKLITRSQKIVAYYKIENLIHKEPCKIQLKTVETLFNQFDIDIYKYSKNMTLTWAHIKEFYNDPNVIVGSHGYNHFKYCNLTYEEITNEVENANKYFIKYTGQNPKHFAYPYGGRGEVNRREIDFLQRFNFKTCVTGRVGNVFSDHNKFLNCLPRLIIKQNRNDFSNIRVLLSGMHTALSTGFKKLVTD